MSPSLLLQYGVSERALGIPQGDLQDDQGGPVKIQSTQASRARLCKCTYVCIYSKDHAVLSFRTIIVTVSSATIISYCTSKGSQGSYRLLEDEEAMKHLHTS